ncbi:tetratricopeptide repeat protein [Clostridium sp. Marseille-P299]|uniref:tetratricopeptide repeat protein n=1 Tax=Clostridium sp. Marseille-P299 TaxID=1805477 RepID=UPI00082ED94A|nr:hypothetical protein [Clostridium sp. Marseille-P299]
MERYHNIVKIEKIKKCLEQEELGTALKVAQTINKKKIKNLSDLSILAEAFFQNKHYEEAREIFLSIYSKNKARRILAQLVHLSIKLNDVEGAEKYLEEFKRIAPKDFYHHIYRYNIDKMAGKEIDVLIADLEALKNDSYMESWAYELAKLYHKASMKDKCIEECSNIILWFGNGVYVEKAKALKAYYMGEIDLSEIEGKEQELREEQIAKQIKNILSEYELKEKEKEGSLEKYNEDEEGDTVSKKEYQTQESVEDFIDEFNTEEDIDNFVEESIVEESMENSAEEVEVEESMENSMEEVEIEESMENSMEEVEVEESLENSMDESEVEESIESTIEEDKVEESLKTLEEVDGAKDSKGYILEEKVVKESIENSVIENKEVDVTKSSETIDNSVDAVETSEKESSIKEPLLNKSELEAMKKSLLKHANLLENEKLDLIYNEEDAEFVKDNELVSEEVKETKDATYQAEPINLSSLSLDENKELYRIIQKEGIKVEDILRNYVRMDTVGKQVIQCLQNIVDDGYNNVNFIITGPKSSGKTYLAKCISKFMRKINRNVSSKIALIDSNKLNEIDLESKKKQLINCTLIIERAGSLNAKSIAWLLELYKSHTNCALIYLEDNMENMNKLLEKHMELKEVFLNRIEVPNYTAEDYLGFAYDYLTEREYEIEVDAYELLHDKLQKQLQQKREYSLDDVFSLMHSVIKNAEDRSAKQLLIHAQKGEFKNSDLLVITKEDVDRA